jgi:hypothetical protein
MISHPGIAAWYDYEVKGSKEGIAYITKTRSHVTFENSAEEAKNLKLQENRMAPLGFAQTRVFPFSVPHRILGRSWLPRCVLKSVVLAFLEGLCACRSGHP